MPGKLIAHAMGAYHSTKRFLAHHAGRATKMAARLDLYSNMFRRVLSAAQPLLQDIGVAEPINRTAMKGISAYDEAKSAVVGARDRAQLEYGRIAAAVGQ